MKIFGYIVALMAFALSAPATATIIGGTVTGGDVFALGSTFIKLTVPLANPFGPANSVGNDNFQKKNLYGFDEDQNILIPAALNIDVGTSPVAAGTVVASHYIFFDPAAIRSVDGTVDFDSNVLGIITSTGFLAASDFLANTGVNYLNPGARGLEPGDFVTISGPRQIRFMTTASTPGDYVRVLTMFSPGGGGGMPGVPEPASWAMMLFGFAGIGLVLRKHARAKRLPLAV